MSKSPLVKNPVVKYVLKVDGKKFTAAPIQSIKTNAQIFKVATATISISFLHGKGDNKTFDLLEKNFDLGSKIELGLAYSEKAEKTIFKGLLVRQQLKTKGGGQNILTLHCANEAVKLTLGRNSDYLKGKDSSIISKLISNHGLKAEVDSTSYEHKAMIQYQSVDWDFIAARAEANGLILYTTDKSVCVKKPEVSGSAQLKVSFSKDVFDFSGDIEARFQMSKISTSSWNPKTQKIVNAKSVEPKLNKQGSKDEKGSALADVLGVKDFKMLAASNMEKEELESWGNGHLLKHRLSRLKGTVTFVGNPDAELNTLIELDGFGKRYNGQALITGVIHHVEFGFWKTTVKYGLSPQFYYETRDIHQPSNGGLFPKIEGLQIGKVKQIDKDEDGEYRVLVDIPLIKESGTGIWARLTNLYATKEHGLFFFPEKDDEVIVGFLDNNPRSAIILGSVYSSKNAPPYTPDEENTKKAILTKGKLLIEFDDEKKVISIETPNKNKILLTDDDEKIVIKDCNKNSIEMSSSGIVIKSNGDLNLKASGNINLDAQKDITIKTSMGDVTTKGKNITEKATMSYSAQASVSSEIKSNGNTTVKGLMVMIN